MAGNGNGKKKVLTEAEKSAAATKRLKDRFEGGFFSKAFGAVGARKKKIGRVK